DRAHPESRLVALLVSIEPSTMAGAPSSEMGLLADGGTKRLQLGRPIPVIRVRSTLARGGSVLQDEKELNNDCEPRRYLCAGQYARAASAWRLARDAGSGVSRLR